MTINPNQLSVTKIYPGNYANVLRYWHQSRSVVYRNANGVEVNMQNQPIGGPVGVIFRPGWIAQQAIGYVDLSYQALGTINQLEYYTQPYGSGQNGANQPFTSANVIIPSPDYHKDVRADISDGISVPAGAYVYRSSLRVSGGDVISSGIAGGQAAPALTVAPGFGYPDGGATTLSGAFSASIVGSDGRIANGSVGMTNIIDSSAMTQTTTTTQWKLQATAVAGTAVTPGSGIYDPRAHSFLLEGQEKSLALCEVCWLLPDQPPERQDLALQPDGTTESSVYTSTVPGNLP